MVRIPLGFRVACVRVCGVLIECFCCMADRYWAITDPITYPSRMTPSKASLFILGLWLCSALISFPAIVWWRAVQKVSSAPRARAPVRCTPLANALFALYPLSTRDLKLVTLVIP